MDLKSNPYHHFQSEYKRALSPNNSPWYSIKWKNDNDFLNTFPPLAGNFIPRMFQTVGNPLERNKCTDEL